MPTARELLEQADALMRRDRDALTTGERARPSSSPITMAPRPLAGAAVSPRTIQHEPIAPSVARTALPVHPTDSPAFATAEAPPFPPPATVAEPAVAPAPPADAAPAIDEDFPTLTDAVVDVVEAEVAGEDAGDEVPLLTDAIESLEVAADDALAAGEPSIWDLAARGEHSVLGRAPDSVVAVPPLDRLPVAPSPARDPLGLDQPAPGFVAPPSALAPAAHAAEPAAHALAESPAAAPAEPSAAAPSAWSQEAEAPSSAELPLPPDDEPLPVPPEATGHGGPMTMPPLHGVEALAGFAPLRPQPGYEPSASPDGADAGAPATPAAAGEAFAVAEGAAAVAATAAPALDEARIAEAVDEIRMQVLQRIDIFTDTTLRAKLGEQLQPLVERASADLVAAINQHVGDLLRTHVAEALEQEIERWRDGQR